MFSRISNALATLSEDLRAVEKAIRTASDGLRDATLGGGDAERLASLEGAFEKLIGQVEAETIRAEAFKATARAAEDRARGHMKRGDKALELANSAEGGEEEDPFERAAREQADNGAEGNEATQPALLTVSQGLEDRRARRDLARSAKRRA